MKKIILIIVILLINTTFTFAKEKISIDNQYIQEYKGTLGKWVKIKSNKSLLFYSKKYSTSIDDIYIINNIRKITSNTKYLFIPYSESYLNFLKEKKICRKTTETLENEFIWPIDKIARISSVVGYRNGRFHPGLDIAAPIGDPIKASMGGRVIFSGYKGGYGKCIDIEHRNDFITRYSHNYVNFLKKGDFVKKGQIIGLVGSTGNSTGNHLHFEIRCSNIPLDSLDFLQKNDNIRIVHTLKNWK